MKKKKKKLYENKKENVKEKKFVFNFKIQAFLLQLLAHCVYKWIGLLERPKRAKKSGNVWIFEIQNQK